MPVANISLSFQLSGFGEGFTRSWEIVMMVPAFKIMHSHVLLFDNQEEEIVKLELVEILPSLSIAIIRTMKGGKSYSHINARSTKPSCNTIEFNIMKS